MRKVLVVGGIGFGVSLSFVGLLVVGTYSAAAGLGAASAVTLAKGAVPSAYQTTVQKWGNLCPSLNPALLAAQLYQESGWNPRAKSPANALGVAQFVPGTWATHGIDGNGDGKKDIWDPPTRSRQPPRTTAHSPDTSRTCPVTRATTCSPRTTRARMR